MDPSGHFALALPIAIGVVLVLGLTITYSSIETYISVNKKTYKKLNINLIRKIQMALSCTYKNLEKWEEIRIYQLLD